MNHPNLRLPGQPVQLVRLDIFDSLAEFAEASAASHSKYNDPQWAGGSFEEAQLLAMQGWEAPLTDITTAIDDEAEVLQFAPLLDVAGDQVDLDLFLANEPECMLSYPLQPRSISSVSLMVPICYSHNVGEETARMRGVAVAAAIENFRERGITVNVYAYMALHSWSSDVRHSNKKVKPCAVILVRLADSRFAYDPGRVAYGAGHPTMLRQLMFGFEDGWPTSPGHGYNKSDYSIFDCNGVRGTAPYSLARSDREVADFVYGLLDTEVTVDLPELTSTHNEYSQAEHNKEVMRAFGTSTGDDE